MLTLSRQLVALDMVCTELAEYASKVNGYNNRVPLGYLHLLKQFCLAIEQLSETANGYKQFAFIAEVDKFGLVLPITNTRILSVYLRLIEYVLDYYQATEKIAGIIDSHFDDNAEKRLQLLQTRAIRAKAQFKIVVQALGKPDYQQFAHHLALPLSDWGWDALRLETQ
jgi:hypothetical protein